ncbi:MAG: hypothetical protein OXQ29_15220 [Rhodospirillaceae bacterium]|nr:hypothetical protein [Rhodospirillaceae bacterium]
MGDILGAMGPLFVFAGFVLWVFSPDLRVGGWLKETFRLVCIVLAIAAGSWLLAADRATARDLERLAREVRVLGVRIGPADASSPPGAGESVDSPDQAADRLERVVERLEDAVLRLERASDSLGTRGEGGGSAP